MAEGLTKIYVAKRGTEIDAAAGAEKPNRPTPGLQTRLELQPGGGPRYRAAIFVANDNERTIARVSKEQPVPPGRKIRKPKAFSKRPTFNVQHPTSNAEILVRHLMLSIERPLAKASGVGRFLVLESQKYQLGSRRWRHLLKSYRWGEKARLGTTCLFRQKIVRTRNREHGKLGKVRCSGDL